MGRFFPGALLHRMNTHDAFKSSKNNSKIPRDFKAFSEEERHSDWRGRHSWGTQKQTHLHIKSHKQYSTNYRKEPTSLRNKIVKSYQSLLDNIELTLSLFSSLITAAFPLTAPNTPITHDCTLHTTESGLYELIMSIRPYE